MLFKNYSGLTLKGMKDDSVIYIIVVIMSVFFVLIVTATTNCLSCFHHRVNCLPAKSLLEGKI